ncbi:unnamed protein product [Didymodactylos carnosus]|uniref:Sacsin/Nov domain-containing protein n=1 Tax=Didymodactylos carnosus TaxID=1234261 RepID=A0A8S2T192_9BILA|nr:unnamed protein product [Didymodactylos carnosus]CAF4255922.1 unnamed protein product [Didymodactylos carnosus]
MILISYLIYNLYAKHATNQAESLKSLSNDLYTDSVRFMYELLQNADDVSLLNILNNRSKVTIATINNYLIIAHNDIPFSNKDLRAVSSINNGIKIKDQLKIGYKGLGFKAVFGKSSYVLIYTAGEYFRFDSSSNFPWRWQGDQDIWEAENDRKFMYPWQIIPIWTETKDVPSDVHSFIVQNSCSVSTIMLLHNKLETKQGIQQLKDQPHTLLFLRNIVEIHFNLDGLIDTFTMENNVINVTKTLVLNNHILSRWIVKQTILDIPASICENLKNDLNIPGKLKSAQQIKLFFAAKYNNNNAIQKLESALFAYIPTKILQYKGHRRISSDICHPTFSYSEDMVR